MPKLSISAPSEFIISKSADSDDSDRPTIPMPLAPKSDNSYDDMGRQLAFLMDADIVEGMEYLLLTDDGVELIDDVHDRPTLDFSLDADVAA